MRDSYSAFDHLWRGPVFSETRRRRLIAMLTACLDESGTDGVSPIVMVGGYVSTVDLWEKFAVEWAQFLKSENLEVFHANEIQDKELHQRAQQVINRNVLFGV